MTQERRVKAFRIAKKLCDLAVGLPDEHRARRFLCNCVRFERIMHNQHPFRNPRKEYDYHKQTEYERVSELANRQQ